MSTKDSSKFSTKLGLILSVLGIAVGTGNIWRFPRIAAQNGGDDGAGAFLVAWIIFLFLWSVPLIIAEYGIGRFGGKGIIASFIKVVGEKFAWMGAFIGFVATAIMFYYSVVAGWCIYYLLNVSSTALPTSVGQADQIWTEFQGSGLPVLFHFIAISLGGYVVAKGIKSIEKVNKILIPTLVLILIAALIRALTLPGSMEGVQFLFTPDWETLTRPRIWLEALTQNAWDTGAGWGLILTYGAYMRKSDDITISAFQTGIGNNIISLVAAIIIFSTVFGTLGQQMNSNEVLEIMQTSGPAGTGLTFMWMPQLFAKMPGGLIFAILFFLGLSFAAFSSLISMVELSTRVFVDMGINRKMAAAGVCSVGFLLGLPSAISLDIFANQDFVWGLGLMISGAFIAISIVKYNVTEFRKSAINIKETPNSLGSWWDKIITYCIPLQVAILLGWWMYQSATVFAPDSWYDPFSLYSVASVLTQWAFILVILIWANKYLVKNTK